MTKGILCLEVTLVTEEQWQAILQNDAGFDDHFFYAVRTTGIYCRPSCKSKAPNKENVRIYSTKDQASSAGFRPCKRCKPTGERLPDSEWVSVITQYIDNHYAEPIPLDVLAEACHGSPYHLQRTFKKVLGIAPVEYVQQVRIMKAKEQLIHTDRAIANIAMSVGMSNVPYFITLYKKKTAHTPSEFRLLYKHNLEVLHDAKVNK
nr:bifunctional transcriptional activator/DNA repair enzyme AdaA [Paenibacillus wynnii]